MKINWKSLFRKNKDQELVKEKELKMFYDIGPIDETGATYRLIVGQRSNGKTYSACGHILDDYLDNGDRGAYIRRWDEDIQPKNIASLFDPHISKIIEKTDGNYNSIFYRAKEFHLAYTNEEGKIERKDPIAFCVTASINTAEHTKGQDRGPIKTIIFDEFATRQAYLPNEFILFCNLLSSLIRNREDTIIYMLANTVNRYCPYFDEMGLSNAPKQTQGTIDLYTYKNKNLTVAMEYCDPVKATEKVSNKFFAFDNPQLEMIKTGQWELATYPHPPYKILDSYIRKYFYVEFGGELIKGEIIANSPDLFIFFHPQTKDIEINEKEVFYTSGFTTSSLHCHYLKDCPTPLHKLIKDLVLKKAMCFSSNEVGEVIRNWLINDQNINIL